MGKVGKEKEDKEEERHFVSSKHNSHDCSSLVGKYWMREGSITLSSRTQTNKHIDKDIEMDKSLKISKSLPDKKAYWDALPSVFFFSLSHPLTSFIIEIAL